jgi:DNA-binding transcriptional regulator YbjK
MKAGFKYALGVVIVALAVIILFQLRNMSRLRNHMSRLEGDTRALHSVLNSNALSSMAAEDQIRRLQRENAEIREQLQRMSNRFGGPIGKDF